MTATRTPYEMFLAPRTWGAGEGYLYIQVDCKLVKDDIDRYKVIIRSTGQIIGYVWQSESYNERKDAFVRSGDWKVGISNGAYYPADTEYPLTRTARITYSGTGYRDGYAKGQKANIGGMGVGRRSAGALSS